MASRRLELIFTGDTSSMERAFRRANRATRDAERSVTSFGSKGARSMALLKSGALAAGAAIGTGLAMAVGTGIREMVEMESATARLKNIIETTGGAAGVTADHVKNLANEIEGLTGTEDDLLVAGGQVLLQFDKITTRGGVFDRALRLANDMAVEFGQDVPTAARRLARVLQDPERGMGVLARAVGRLSEEQQKNIDRMIAHGNVIGAQNFLMDQLEKKFKGAAESQGRVTEAVQKAQRAWENASEQMIYGVVVAIEKVIEWVKRNQDTLDEWVEAVRSIVRTATEFWRKYGDDIREILGFIGRHFQRVLVIIREVVNLVSAILRGDWGDAWKAARKIVQTVIDGLLDWLRTIPQALFSIAVKIGKSFVSGIGRGLANLGGFLRAQIMKPINAVGGLAGAVASRAREIGIAFVMGIIDGIKDAWHRITDWVSSAASRIDITPGFDLPGPFASGGTIPGRLGQAVPIIAHGGEVVLNPGQQRMLGAGRVMNVLRRTGGIVGGRRFQSGGYVTPVPGGNWAGGPSAHSSRALGNWQSDNAWDIMAPAGTTVYALGDGTVSRVNNYMNPAGQFAGGSLYLSAQGASWFYKHIKPLVGSGPVSAGTPLGTLVSWTNGGPHLHLGTDGGSFSLARAGAQPGSGTGGDLIRTMASTSGTPPELTPFQKLKQTLRRAGLTPGMLTPDVFTSPWLEPGKRIGAVARRIMQAGQLGSFSEGFSGSSLTGAEQRGVTAAGRKAKLAAMRAGKSPDEVSQAGQDAERKAERKVLVNHIRKIDKGLAKMRQRRKDLNADLGKLLRAPTKNKGAKKEATRRIRTALAQIQVEIDELLDMRAEANAAIKDLDLEALEEDYGETYPDTGGDVPEPPSQMDFLEAAAAEAALTPGLDDDITAAFNIMTQRGHELNAARASGDPRLITAAAQAFLAAQQTLDQLKATRDNTDALNANTDALRGFGGSNVISYRGQSHVLRSLAPPSSDRLVGLEVGL